MADSSEIRAGVFLLVALLGMAAGTLWIVGFNPLAAAKPTYEVAMQSSGGVRRGDRIRVAGVAVGRVKSVELTTGEAAPVLFRVALDGDVMLTEGSSARITSDGLLGAPYLEIVLGDPAGRRLPEGTRIVGIAQASLADALTGLGATTDKLPALVDQIGALAGGLEREAAPLLARLQTLLSDDNLAAVSGTLAALEPTLEQAAPRILDMVTRLEELAATLEAGAEGVPELAAEVRALVTDVRTAVGDDGERLGALLETASGTFDTAGGALTTFEINRGEIDAMVHDLAAAAANLRSLSQTLKERPSLLLRSPRTRQPDDGEERP